MQLRYILIPLLFVIVAAAIAQPHLKPRTGEEPRPGDVSLSTNRYDYAAWPNGPPQESFLYVNHPQHTERVVP